MKDRIQVACARGYTTRVFDGELAHARVLQRGSLMPDLQGDAFAIAKYLYEKKHTAGNEIVRSKLKEAVALSDSDFDPADQYLLAAKFCSGTMGGDEGKRWLTTSGVQYVILKSTHVEPARVNAEFSGKPSPITWWSQYHNHVYGAATLVGLVLAVIFFALQYSGANLSGSPEQVPSASRTPVTSDGSPVRSPDRKMSNTPTSPSNESSNRDVSTAQSPTVDGSRTPTEAERTELEIIGHDGKSTFLSAPSIAYPSTFGPSRETEGIVVRRGVEQSTLLWSKIRLLRFRSRQERDGKGTMIWRHNVTATLSDGKVLDLEIVNDWNMAYMGGGGTGLLFGQSELGATQIPLSQISVLRVSKYARPANE